MSKQNILFKVEVSEEEIQESARDNFGRELLK